ncbi:MAG: hypothetical protein HYZ29_15685 [Myxococcales bacterium]|nr:hypothetical protein [Myxococcales bacterium]
MLVRSCTAVLLFAALLLAGACSKKEAPKPKTKDEVLALFEKHKATYIRCEKLLRAEQALLPAPNVSAALPATSASAAPPAPPAPSGRAAPPAPSAAPSAAPRDATSAPTMRVGEAQDCQAGFFRSVKEELGPYDQASVDQWYAEWRAGVKVE